MSGLRDRRGDGAVSWFPPRRCTSQSLGDHIDPVGLLLHDTLFLVCDSAPASVDDQWVAGFPCPRSRLQNRVVMSMQPRPWPEVPADTARVAKRAFRKGSLAIRARDELGCWYDDEVFGGVRELNRLELAGETVRAALEALAAAAPGWLAGVIDVSWQQVYGQRIDQIRLPASQARRDALAVQYGRDGYHLLEAVRGPGAPGWLGDLPAVQALRQVWIQQYYRVIDERGEKVIRREASEHGLPPGRTTIVSPYDTDARYSEKRGNSWLGYKVHFTETCSDAAGDDPGTGRAAAPNLITNVATTEAAVADAAMTDGAPPSFLTADPYRIFVGK